MSHFEVVSLVEIKPWMITLVNILKNQGYDVQMLLLDSNCDILIALE